MDSIAVKPKGWLNFYLVLLLLGGLPFIACGLLLALYNFPLGLIGISGGIVVSLCSLLSGRGFRRGNRSGIAYAKAGDILFAMTTIFFTINFFYFEVTPKSAALMIVTVIWCVLWWWYLSKSAQVKRLSVAQGGSSQKGVVLLAVMFAVFAGLTAWVYARMQATQAEIRINQMRERIRIQTATAEREAAQAAAEQAESEKAETAKKVAKAEAAQASKSKPSEAQPEVEVAGETVKNLFYSFKVPEGLYYHREENGTYFITDSGSMNISIEQVLVIAAETRLASASIDLMRTCHANDRKFRTFTLNGCKVNSFRIEGMDNGEKVSAIVATKFSPDNKCAVLIQAVITGSHIHIYESILNSITFD